MNRNVLLLIGLTIAVAGVWFARRGISPAAVKMAPVSGDVPSIEDPGSLRDLRGSRRSLADFQGHRACVLVFLGVECPLANLYVPELIRLHRRYSAQDVLFLGIYSHAGETIDRVAAHALEHKIPFTVLRDIGQGMADAVGVKRTPEVCLLDSRFGLRYRGRISDQYGVAHRRAKSGRDDLAIAIDELLADKAVSVTRTAADGCLLNRHRPRPSNKQVLFSRDVAPIMQRRCQVCHREQGQAPFSLTTYEDAAQLAEMIKEVVSERLMPPWHADAPRGRFRNDRRLTDDEIETIVAWVDNGQLPGRDDDMPPAKSWRDRWVIGQPDVVIHCPKKFEIPPDGIMPYQYAEVPAIVMSKVFPKDRWIKAAQVLPQERSVVHHVSIIISRPGGSLYSEGSDLKDVIAYIGWAPGDPVFSFPPGVGMKIPAGSRLEFELHYTPNGRAVTDRSSLALIFWDAPPPREARVICALNLKFKIPPGDSNYRAESTYRLPCDARLLASGPHMHLRGKSMLQEAIYPDGRVERLFSVPRYDFNWQTWYWYADPPRLPKGTRLHSVAYWDNSAENLFNPDPMATVEFGEQTTDEMMAPYAVIEVDPANDLPGGNVDLFVQ